MSDDLPDSLIPYDEIVQEALRAVVGRVLGQIDVAGTRTLIVRAGPDQPLPTSFVAAPSITTSPESVTVRSFVVDPRIHTAEPAGRTGFT